MILTVALCVNLSPAFAEEAQPPGAALTDFLLNLSRYTVWPGELNRGRLLICIADGGSLSGTEAQWPAGATSNGRAVSFVAVDALQEIAQCQVLWVNADARPAPRDWLRAVRNLPILTVSNYADFTADGGIIGAQRRGNGWRFEINTDGLHRTQLKIMAAALRLSTRFQSGQGAAGEP